MSHSIMDSPKHILFISYALWGHLRPMTAIVSGLLPLHPNLHITFFVHASFADLVEAEITRYKLPRDDRARLHCVRFGDQARSYLSPPQNVPKLAQEVMENAKTSYPRVLKGESIVDSVTKEAIPSFQIRPSTVVFDYVVTAAMPQLLSEIEEAGGYGMSKYLSCSPLARGYSDCFIFDRVDQPVVSRVHEDIEKGLELPEAVKKHIHDNDKIVHVSGCAPMYVYEMVGNIDPVTFEFMVRRTKDFRKVIPKVDGFIYYAIRRPAISPLREILPQDKPEYLVGPLPPTGREVSPGEKSPILTFLDGEPARSVAYISFGSLFFSPDESQVKVLIEVLAKRSSKTILVSGNCSPEMRSLISRTIEAQPEGTKKFRVETWVDQQAILGHRATSWFLTHAGQGAISEGISAGVPMIFWPSGVDQPFIANQLSQTEKVGIELIQIRRTVAIGKPTYRGPTVQGTDEAIGTELEEAFRRMDGPEREEFQRQVDRVRAEFEKDRAEGGKGWKALMEVGRV